MMVTRVSSPELVGRRAELQQLHAAVERAIAGETGPVLIAGEAGVGKTRLLAELAAWARARGCLVLTGGCVSLSADVAPFAPIIEAFRPLTRDLPRMDLDALLGPNGRGLAPLLPDLEAAAETSEVMGISPDTAHGRLLELLLAMVGRLSERSPVLLVVEDIHWADRSTVDVLAFLVRNLRSQPVQLITSFRTDEPQSRGNLLPFIAEMGRQPRATRIDLPRLNRVEVAEQLSAILGRVVDASLVDGVYARSQGNAFYSEELLAAEPIAGALPETLRDVLRARVRALGHEASELVRVASAAGRQFTEELLARLTEARPAAFRAALREAIDHQILAVRVDGGDGRLGFRHALVQELLYADLLPSERVRLHAACASAIEERLSAGSDGALASELAYHWQAADEPARALRASVIAGLAAESAGAQAEAALQFERGLALLEQVPASSVEIPLDHVQLLEHAAANHIGNPSRAVQHIRAAIELVDPATEPGRAGLLQAALGRYLWFSGDGAAALEACREAVRLVPAEPPSAERARVTAGLGQILMILAHFEEAVRYSREAVQLASATGARLVESHALNTLGVLTAYLDDADTGLGMLHRALEIARESESVDDIARAYANLQDVLIVAAARFDEAAQIAHEAVDPSRTPSLSGVWAALVLADAAWAHYLGGRWDDAAATLERARPHASAAAGEIECDIRAAQLLVGRGDFRAAAHHLDLLDQQLEGVADTQWIAPTAAAHAEYSILTGDPARALSAVADGLERTQASFGANVSRIGPLLALGVRAAVDLAERQGGRRSGADLHPARRQATEHLDAMQAIRDEIATRWPAHLRLAEPYLALCRAEASRLDGRSDPETWAEAARLLRDLSLVYLAAYARYREGEALLGQRRDAARARTALGEALATAQGLRAAPLAAAVEAVAGRGRIDLGVAGDRPGRSAGPSGLTAREQEILQLVAGGLTNREIGERLFITEKTASHHVSNILGKLNVRGRAEAAAEAVRLGITPPPP